MVWAIFLFLVVLVGCVGFSDFCYLLIFLWFWLVVLVLVVWAIFLFFVVLVGCVGFGGLGYLLNFCGFFFVFSFRGVFFFSFREVLIVCSLEDYEVIATLFRLFPRRLRST